MDDGFGTDPVFAAAVTAVSRQMVRHTLASFGFVAALQRLLEGVGGGVVYRCA